MNKSLRFSLVVVFALLASSLFAEDNSIRVVSLWNNTNMLVNSTSTSMALDLVGYKPESFAMSVQITCTNSITNSGAITLSREQSNDGVDFPFSTNIVAGFSFTNSSAGDGKYIYFFTPEISRYIRFKLVTSLTNADVSVWLATQ